MTKPLLVGWLEYVKLPQTGGKPFRAKIDTGARTSALHARSLRVEPGTGGAPDTAVFRTGSSESAPEYRLPVIGYKRVRSSNGRAEKRPTIRVDLAIGPLVWPVEVTLTDRRAMKYQMLVGREALAGRVIVDPSRSLILGKRKSS